MSIVAPQENTVTLQSAAFCESWPRPHLTTALLVSVDFLVVTAAAIASILLVYTTQNDLSLQLYAPLLPFMCVSVLIYAAVGLYPGVLSNPVDEMKKTVIATTVFYMGLGVSSFLYHDARSYSRPAFLLGWVFTICALPAARWTLRHLCSRRSWWGYPVVVIGTKSSVADITSLLQRCPTQGLRVIGSIEESSDLLARTHSPRAGFRVLRHAYYGILSFPDASQAELRQHVLCYSEFLPRLLFLPDLVGYNGLRLNATNVDNRLALEVRNSLQLPYTIWIKRALDTTVASIALILFLPLFLVLMLAVKVSSRGPIFFGHTRLGKGERPFKVYKFRSMVTDGDDILRKHFVQNPLARMEWESTQKLRRDPRVGAVGRFLRVTSLDELPQLWNVIRGDMSLVGPRPIVQGEAARYADTFEVYKRVLPGITGLWQVSGRNLTTYAQRVALDEYYVRNWSVWLDLHILLRTVIVVATRQGAS